MRTPHLATSALAVAAAMMGGGQTLAQGNPMELTFRMSPQLPSYDGYRAQRTGHLPGSYGKANQNKVRKDRRRAHAAGSKKAFA